jgi:nucleotide-binding universal stress UspA family protein
VKIEHILFPIDFSEHSRALNSEVEWLASHFNAHVTLLHVFEVPTSWYGGGEFPLITSEDILRYADLEKQRLKDYPIQIPESRIERVSAEGSAACHIAHWSAKHDIDLVVMGTHGYGTFRRFLLGSVAMKVLHDVRCPVWTHSAHVESWTDSKKISRIVCALDLADEAVSVLRFTKELAAEFGAEVHLVHTIPEMESRSYRYFGMVFHRELMDFAKEQIRKLQHEAGTEFPLSLTDEYVAQDTAEVALMERADLIVIGRGKTRANFGSLRTHAYDIIRQARCPVLSYSMDRKEASSSAVESDRRAEPLATP